jgi:hypothetical protein
MNNRNFLRRENTLTKGIFAIPQFETTMMLYHQADKKTETVKPKNWGKPIAFGPIMAFTIAQVINPGLSSKGHELFVFLDSQNTHCWDHHGCALLS